MGRSRHSRLPAGLGFSRFLEAREFVAAGFARVGVLAKLGVPFAKVGGFHCWFSLVGALFREGRSERCVRRAALLRLGELGLLALLDALLGAALLGAAPSISLEATVDRVDVIFAVRVNEVGNVVDCVHLRAGGSMNRLAIAVKILIRELDGLGAVSILDFVVDGSAYIRR